MSLYTKTLLLLLLLTMGSNLIHAEPDKQIQDGLDSATARAFRVGARNRDSAIQMLGNIYKQCEQVHYVFGKASALMACGVLHATSETSAIPALMYFRKAGPFIKEAARKDDRIRSRWYTCMGAAFTKTGKRDSAMYFYTLSLNANLKRKNIDYKTLIQNYMNLEILYYEEEQYDKTLRYAHKIIPIARDKGFKHELLNTYLIMSGTFIEMKNFDSSEVYSNKADKLSIQPNDIEKKSIYEIKGTLLLHQNNPTKAITFFEAALKVNNMGSPTSLKGLGNAYYKLQNYPLAEKYLFQAKEDVEKQFKNSSFLIQVYNDIADLYQVTERYKEAYTYRTHAEKMGKEFANLKQSEMINRLETKYRSSEQEKQITAKQISLLSAENNLRNKNVWMGIIVAIAMSMAIIILLLFQKQRAQSHRLALQQQQQEIEKLKAVINAEEKERNRIGIELHDNIMGQLSIIKINMEVLPDTLPDLNYSRDYQNIKEMVDNAGRDIRQTAHNLTPDALLSEGLVQAIFYFTNNVQRRSGISINFQHYGYMTIQDADIEISLYRITQELLQNVIKHALASNILLQLSQREDMITLTVEDDGVGLDEDYQNKGGMGLRSIHNRLKAMNGSIDIHQRKPKGTSVTVEINIS